MALKIVIQLCIASSLEAMYMELAIMKWRNKPPGRTKRGGLLCHTRKNHKLV